MSIVPPKNGYTSTVGLQLQQWTTPGGTNQQWYLQPTGDGYFTMVAGTRVSNGTEFTEIRALPGTASATPGCAGRRRRTLDHRYGANQVHIGRNFGITPLVLDAHYVDPVGDPLAVSALTQGCSLQ